MPKLFRVGLNRIQQLLLLRLLGGALDEAPEPIESEQKLNQDPLGLVSEGNVEQRSLFSLAFVDQMVEKDRLKLRSFRIKHFDLCQDGIATFEDTNNIFRNFRQFAHSEIRN